MGNLEACKICGGRCCKWVPGMYAVDDFKALNATNISNLLLKLSAHIKEIIYYSSTDLTVDYPVLVIAPVGGNLQDCVHLKNTGCVLSSNKRPKECRLLQPSNSDKGCTTTWNKNKELQAWLLYDKILKKSYTEKIN